MGSVSVTHVLSNISSLFFWATWLFCTKLDQTCHHGHWMKAESLVTFSLVSSSNVLCNCPTSDQFHHPKCSVSTRDDQSHERTQSALPRWQCTRAQLNSARIPTSPQLGSTVRLDTVDVLLCDAHFPASSRPRFAEMRGHCSTRAYSSWPAAISLPYA